MKSNGFVKIYRSLLDHPIFTQCPHTVPKVWLVCLIRANWQKTKWYDGRAQIELPAGSFVFSQEKLAEDCCMSRKQIRTALKHLQNLGCVAIKRASGHSLLVVEKWSLYQLEGPEEGHLSGHERATAGPQEGHEKASIYKEEEVKKGRREEENSALVLSWEWEVGFNEWWHVWSAVRGTQRYLKASEAYGLCVTPATRQEALECAASYLRSLDHPNQGFYPDTFLRQQSEDGFKARFPSRRPQTAADKALANIASNVVKHGRLW